MGSRAVSQWGADPGLSELWSRASVQTEPALTIVKSSLRGKEKGTSGRSELGSVRNRAESH